MSLNIQEKDPVTGELKRKVVAGNGGGNQNVYSFVAKGVCYTVSGGFYLKLPIPEHKFNNGDIIKVLVDGDVFSQYTNIEMSRLYVGFEGAERPTGSDNLIYSHTPFTKDYRKRPNIDVFHGVKIKNRRSYNNSYSTTPTDYENCTWLIEDGTSLDLMYLEEIQIGTSGFLIMGNPTVLTYSETVGESQYSVRADGFIEQQKMGTIDHSSNFMTVYYDIMMNRINYNITLIKQDGTSPDSTMGYNMTQYNDVTQESIKFRVAGTERMTKYNLCVKGY